MSNYPVVPPLPESGDGDALESANPVTREVDGEEVLDPDAADERIDSAEADRLAAQGDQDADDEP